jgi:HPt (histidine-containing phosphotransfer) domain-containing protein
MGFETAEVEWSLPEALQELAVAGDREIVAEVLTLFQADTESRLQDLRGAVECGDRRRMCAQAHSMKGSAIQVGANALADSCREMELTAETRQDLMSLLEEIETRFTAVSKAISLEYGAVQ